MCRLFGFRSNVPTSAHRSLASAENAMVTQAQKHSDGWGVGYFIGKEPYLFRAARGAAVDNDFITLSQRLQSKTFLVHVRKATVGQVDTLNSHPFRYGSWLFAHNGTIFEFDRMKDLIEAEIADEFKQVLFGSTDSERYFFFLLSHMKEAGIPSDGRGALDLEAACQAQQRAISKIFRWAQELNIEPPKANYILTNGSTMFARRAGLELYLSTQKKVCADALLCKEANKICLAGVLPHLQTTALRPRKCNHLLVASEPIDEENIWEEIPDGSLIALDDNMKISLHPAPEPFWVTWPPVISKHPQRPNVIPA